LYMLRDFSIDSYAERFLRGYRTIPAARAIKNLRRVIIIPIFYNIF
jgi:hypothetical protein